MNLTDRQREIVNDRRGDLLVAASAGSGKTETLAQRVLALVRDPDAPVNIDRLLIVTFTRAAAAELRGRIAGLLRRAAAEASDRAHASQLRRQELLLDVAEIGTIDAWCARLAREHYADAGIDPAFRVLNQEQAELLRSEVLDELFEWIFTAKDALAVSARDWISRQAQPDDDFLRQMVARLSRFLGQLRNPDRWRKLRYAALAQDDAALRQAESRAVSVDIQAELLFQTQQIERLLQEDGRPDFTAAIQRYAEELRDLSAGLKGGEAPAAIIERLAASRALKPPRNSNERDALEQLDRRWRRRRLTERWSTEKIASIALHAREVANHIECLLRLEVEFEARLEQRKRNQSTYEFQDVLRIALSLLSSTDDRSGPSHPSDLALRLRERYAAVIVDEFQDTSPLQVELIELVSRSDAAHAVGNRFLVGDVKQSIYGFRHAAPQLFAALAERSRAQRPDSVKPLADNFRSHRDLLAPLNAVFSRLFEPGLGGAAYGEDECLLARRTEPQNPTLDRNARVEVYSLDDPQRGAEEELNPLAPSLRKIEREARVIAQQVQRLLAAGVQIAEQRDGAVGLRPARLADFVVLLRSAVQNAPRLAAALRREGLNASAVGRDALLDSPEVIDLIGALSLLGNRQQDLALAAYLRGPLVELSERELLETRRAAPRGGFFQAAQTVIRGPAAIAGAGARELKTKLERAFKQLDAWCSVARRADLAAVVRRILQDTQLDALAAAQPGGPYRVAMLEAFQQLAAEYAARIGGSVGEFCTYLEALRAQEVAPDAMVAPAAEAIRVMTIHAAKGLQFPIVFLALAGAAFDRRVGRGRILLSESLGVGLREPDYAARSELTNAAALSIDAQDRRRELDEEVRLLYVAATRAQELFVMTGHAPSRELDELERSAGGVAPTLMEKLTARSALEWFIVAARSGPQSASAATGQIAYRRVAADETEPAMIAGGVVSGTAGAPAEPHDPHNPASAADEEWVRTSLRLIEQEIDQHEARRPATISVSRAKQVAKPSTLAWAAATLKRPSIGRGTPVDGTGLGSAWHRFLAMVNLRKIDTADDVQEQLRTLVAQRRLTLTEAALISPEDITWFGQTPEGQLLSRHAAFADREQPFVWALPNPPPARRQSRPRSAQALLRGTIDCVFSTEQGLVVYDYKTDRRRSDWDERIERYQAQVGWYAAAISALRNQPIVRASLIFLRERVILPAPAAELEWK